MLIFETTIYCNLEAKEKSNKKKQIQVHLANCEILVTSNLQKMPKKNQARTFPYPSVKRRVKQTKLYYNVESSA